MGKVEWKEPFPFPRRPDSALGYAVLFHDIGKQDTYSKDERERVHFYHHEVFSCQAAERIMERLRFSNLMRDRVLRLIQESYEDSESLPGDEGNRP